MRTFLRLVALSYLTAALIRAQTSDTATVVGAVSDTTGAAISVATVALVDLAHNQTRRQSVNAEGQYTINGIIPGTYRVTTEAAGFRRAIIPSFKVDVANRIT
jgi:hypothetical protein